jgi:hypothetical protein
MVKHMRTPAGFECRYFYGNYFRGRNEEECRLITPATAHLWSSDLCRSCPVPALLRANACPHLILEGNVQKTMLGLVKKIKVSAYCSKSAEVVTEPQIGCGQCHPSIDFLEDTRA